jgi:fused signal recognition particle receptor
MFSFLAIALVGKLSSIHAPFIPRCPIESDVGLLSVKLNKLQTMAFNWFRRPNNEPADTPQTQTQEEIPAVEASQPETTVPDTADLLAFAKAAYKNIQEKQQIETESSVAVEEDTTTQEIVETEVEELTPPLQIDATVAEITEDVVSELQPEPEIANLSFLERAEAERQAKQEKLIASAIETVAPETPIITTEPEIEIPELVFDDGFKWSAKVLAAQGRKAEDISIEEINWLKKLRQGLDKTRRNLLNQLKAIVGQGPLNQDAVNEIESLLLQADVGVEATDYIISALQKKLLAEVTPPEQAIFYLKEILRDMLDTPLQNQTKPSFAPEKDQLTIWLITGVNGAGKTTTIGKISHLAQKSGYKCLIGAADTFRAAAVEQVKVWGNRSGVEVIANPGKNTDPAAVVFDAIAAAESRGTELLLIDTAGRLQNKKNLMDELGKIRKIITKKAPNARVESLLVLDSTLGQNGLRQAEVFSQAAQLSGVVLTKLDGTAKGGVALAVVQQLGLPIRFIGAGEGIEDLRPFSSYEFVEALLSG